MRVLSMNQSSAPAFSTATNSQLKNKQKTLPVSLKNVLDEKAKIISFVRFQQLRACLSNTL